MVDDEFDDYPDLSKHHSLMKTYLTRELYQKYKKTVTSNGVTLDQCIQTGIDDPTLDVGLIAGDAECYETFKDLFNPVIRDLHGFDPSKRSNASIDFEEISEETVDDSYIISSRIRCGRSIKGIPFSPCVSRSQRRRVEAYLIKVLEQLRGHFSGKYRKLAELAQDEINKLVEDHILFAKPASDFMRNAGMGRDWPDARGIFFNEEKTFILWVNEEDHLRIISMQKGGNLNETFKRFHEGMVEIERLAKVDGHSFEKSNQLGYLCTCPSNVGTSMRCSVLIRLPLLGADGRFEKIVKKLRLEKRGSHGEYKKSATGIFDISNIDRIEKSETQIVNQVISGVNHLIKLEKRLEQKLDIEDIED